MIRVFFSLDYQRDRHRVFTIHRLPNIISRSAGGFQSSTVWQEAKRRGDAAVHGLIDDALRNTTVSVFCIGFRSAARKFINYEIERSFEQGNGLVGVKVNHLRDQDGVVDKEAHAPLLIEQSGYKVYAYTTPANLVAHIEEAAALAKQLA